MRGGGQGVILAAGSGCICLLPDEPDSGCRTYHHNNRGSGVVASCGTVELLGQHQQG